MPLTLDLPSDLESLLMDRAKSMDCDLQACVIRLIETHVSLPVGKAKTDQLVYGNGVLAGLLTFLLFYFGRPEMPWILDLLSAAMVGFFFAAMTQVVRDY